MPKQPIHLTSKDIARFESKFTKGEGCWNWTACCTSGGYGYFGLGGRRGKDELTHRIAYTLYVGPIPPGLCVLHRCDNPPCVNPAHLWLGTHADNVRDKVAKGRCLYGERVGGAKLTACDVGKIVNLARQPGCTQRLVAHNFGVSPATICNILKGKVWVRVTGTVVAL